MAVGVGVYVNVEVCVGVFVYVCVLVAVKVFVLVGVKVEGAAISNALTALEASRICPKVEFITVTFMV